MPANNPELVLISTWMPYHNMIDAYMDLDRPIPSDAPSYKSGFSHGVSDAKCASQPGCKQYITQPGNGFQFHTFNFIAGLLNGYCSIAWHPISNLDDAGMDGDTASFSCKGGKFCKPCTRRK